MRRQHGRVSGEAVIAFLLFEARFPRSLRYCLRSAMGLFGRLTATQVGGIATGRARLESLDAWLDDQEKTGGIVSDHALLTRVVDDTAAACGAIQQRLAGKDDLALEHQPANGQAQAQ